MTIICQRCNKILDVPDPPGYENMDIIDRFNVWRGADHAICAECVREVLVADNVTDSLTEATDVKE